ncbi:hypothetical protein F2Q69_00046248 [Brassica cretica]|uniref:Amino acid transporter transmembrane domain-containing protein n=1 Tax=Brassica cretica TaxID=69181 RepID=A0A8S9PV75_BRACR|nr:hypothetical protein F2Q69_00046248 [Brassica cretica]
MNRQRRRVQELHELTAEYEGNRAVTAITYSTMVWVLSVSQQRPDTISYEPLSMPSVSGSIFSVLSALGIIAFAFRGHNLVLEMQLMYPCGEELKFLTSSLLFVSFTSSSEAFELIGTFLAGLLGGLTLSVTFAYPCFTWVLIKKPANYSFSGYFHWGLGCLGVAFSLALSIGDIWSMVKLKFFSPKVKLMFKVSGFFLL